MNCGVCIGTSDYEEASFTSIKTVKAKKPHLCCECRREIPIGTRYENYTGCWDGKIETYKTCLDCVSIRDGLSCGQGFIFTCLWDEIYEVFAEITTGCLDKIESASARAYLLSRWRKWKGLE